MREPRNGFEVMALYPRAACPPVKVITYWLRKHHPGSPESMSSALVPYLNSVGYQAMVVRGLDAQARPHVWVEATRDGRCYLVETLTGRVYYREDPACAGYYAESYVFAK
jgi:hypothetical protein